MAIFPSALEGLICFLLLQKNMTPLARSDHFPWSGHEEGGPKSQAPAEGPGWSPRARTWIGGPRFLGQQHHLTKDVGRGSWALSQTCSFVSFAPYVSTV